MFNKIIFFVVKLLISIIVINNFTTKRKYLKNKFSNSQIRVSGEQQLIILVSLEVIQIKNKQRSELFIDFL